MIYEKREKYLEYLIETYSDMIYKLAMTRTKTKENSDDVFQEVFLRLSKKIPEFKSAEHEKAWIIRVTINCSKNIINLFNKNTEMLENIENTTQDYIKTNDDTYYIVQSLPLKSRTIIYLYYYEKYKIEEISEILNIKANTIKSILARSREKIKSKMKGGDFEFE